MAVPMFTGQYRSPRALERTPNIFRFHIHGLDLSEIINAHRATLSPDSGFLVSPKRKLYRVGVIVVDINVASLEFVRHAVCTCQMAETKREEMLRSERNIVIH